MDEAKKGGPDNPAASSNDSSNEQQRKTGKDTSADLAVQAWSELAKKTSTVSIQADNNSNFLSQEKSGGSGFVVTDGGKVVTAAHVVAGTEGITVTGYDHKGVQHKHKAHIEKLDPKHDIAVLQLDDYQKSELPVAKLGDSKNLKAGDNVQAVGYPADKPTTRKDKGDTSDSKYTSDGDRNLKTAHGQVTGQESDSNIAQKSAKDFDSELKAQEAQLKQLESQKGASAQAIQKLEQSIQGLTNALAQAQKELPTRNTDKNMVANFDNQQGMSGGPVYKGDKVVGMTRGMFANTGQEHDANNANVDTLVPVDQVNKVLNSKPDEYKYDQSKYRTNGSWGSWHQNIENKPLADSSIISGATFTQFLKPQPAADATKVENNKPAAPENKKPEKH
jgi:S1-C subfamily serine protease